MMLTKNHQDCHPGQVHRNKITLLAILLLLTHFLTACSTQQVKFDDQNQFTYGDLQVKLIEVGFTRIYEGFVCDNSHYQHPFVTLQLTCSDDAVDGCYIKLTLAVKYEDGASWGRSYFSQSTSANDFQPKTLFLQPGTTNEITFHPSSAVRQCWSINELVKQITFVLRDERGNLKDLRIIFKPD